jgi:TBC1 domain family member 10
MRIGLVILLSCRGQILEATGEQAVLLTLLHPPISFLSGPERFISQALALRFKDDDFRKLRIKMETEVKRQTQARATNTTTSSISLPRN